MTTKVTVKLEEFTGYPVIVQTVDLLSKNAVDNAVLHEAGASVEVYIHQNQDVRVGEIKTNNA